LVLQLAAVTAPVGGMQAGFGSSHRERRSRSTLSVCGLVALL